MIRRPVVAGSFYPGSEAKLREQLGRLVRKGLKKEKVLGAVAPHAGYMYSGAVAGELFSEIEVPGTAVVLAPNHTGLGAPFAAWAGDWMTPLGEIGTDHQLLEAIHEGFPLLADDHVAHMHEHSVEVQLPFIQQSNPGAKMVGIVIMCSELDELKGLGHAVAEAIKKTGNEALVLASSDMTHYEPQEAAEEKDRKALERMLALDVEGLWETVRRLRISMCGVAPAAAMLACSVERGASRAELVKYATSGDVTGDYSQVVGYAAVTVK